MDTGLSSEEAFRRLAQYGPNTLPEEKPHYLVIFFQKFWAPIPWLLEIIIIMEIALRKYPEAGIIFALLLFNAFLSFFEEGKAKKAILLLKAKLEVEARVFRDGEWKLLPARDLVPGDAILIRLGDIIPADVEITSGHLLVDQSALTGESMPVSLDTGQTGYASSIVKQGEAFANIKATGIHTYFGKTAEIVRVAKAPSHLQTTIFAIIKYLIFVDAILVIIVFAFGLHHRLPIGDLLPFSLLLLVASVPVALPATYTLATALGSQELGKIGILVPRLTAIEEAAAMNVLCVDKTGTLTKNILEISDLFVVPPFSKEDLLVLAGLASEEATQDPLDIAILKAGKGALSPYSAAKKAQIIPFDPEKKFVEVRVDYEGERYRILKGAPIALLEGAFTQEIEMLAKLGSRVLAVVFGKKDQLQPVGLVAFKDPLRDDSKQALQELSDLGIRVIMLTGDEGSTARSIGCELGIKGKVIVRQEIDKLPEEEIAKASIVASIFPEDKFRIITLLQKQGNICGMTGDGVNDAPALKRAEVGIAVSNATDVAKASASIILTRPGLTDILETVKMSRKIYQRMLTYTINKIIKTLQIVFILAIGLLIIGNFIITPLLIVLLLFANDFVTMSISTDRVSYSQKPEKWNIQKLMWVGGFFAGLILAISFGVLFYGKDQLKLSLPQLQTLMFLTLVFTGQFTIYLVRERKRFWHSRPSSWMISSSIFDIIACGLLATFGVFMAPLPLSLIVTLFLVFVVCFILFDFIKVVFSQPLGRK